MKNIKSGFSILETIILMSVASTVMMVAVGWIHQSLKFGSIMDQRTEHHATLMRLARELRDDVHRGESLAMESDSALLISMSDNRAVRYAIRNNRVVLSDSEAGKIVRNESFQLAERSNVWWDQSEMPQSVVLVVERASLAHSVAAAPVVDLHVSASVRRWQRLGIREVRE